MSCRPMLRQSAITIHDWCQRTALDWGRIIIGCVESRYIRKRKGAGFLFRTDGKSTTGPCPGRLGEEPTRADLLHWREEGQDRSLAREKPIDDAFSVFIAQFMIITGAYVMFRFLLKPLRQPKFVCSVLVCTYLCYFLGVKACRPSFSLRKNLDKSHTRDT